MLLLFVCVCVCVCIITLHSLQLTLFYKLSVSSGTQKQCFHAQTELIPEHFSELMNVQLFKFYILLFHSKFL